MVLVEQQYKEIRRKLDKLGYHQPCSVESILLVDKLLYDLTDTREKKSQYEEIANAALEKCEEVENSIESYKKENKYLLKENNKIHLEAIQIKDKSERKIKKLKATISNLENMYSDLEFSFMEQMANMGALREELLDKTNKLHELGVIETRSDVQLRQSGNLLKKNDFYDHFNNDSNRGYNEEIENYKRKQHELLDEIEIMENQIQSRDREISRLSQQLELRKDITPKSGEKICSCHLINSCSPQNLYEKVKIAQDKQHEAMQRAISLADRIEELEIELKALRYKNQNKDSCSCGTNITYLQKQYAETLNKFTDMEMKISDLQIEINNLTREKVEAKEKILGLEKEKDNLQEKVTNFKRIEKDITSEIDSLHQKNADLKEEMAHLELKNNDLQEKVKDENKSSKAKQITVENVNGESSCEKLKAERDYFCNELHRLQEKVYSAESIHGIQCCSRPEKEFDKTLLKRLQNDLHFANDENKRLQGECFTLRNQIKEFCSYKHDSNRFVENHIKRLEYDKGALASSNSNLKSKLRSVEHNLEQLEKKSKQLSEELNAYKIKYNHLKNLNTQLEFSLNNSEAAIKRAEMDLAESMTRLNESEKELKRAREEIKIIKNEKQEARENLLRLDHEKDELMLKVDEKTVIISKLDKDMLSKNSQISQMDAKLCEFQTQLLTVERMLQVSEDKCRDFVKDNRKMEQEISTLQTAKQNLKLENQTLKRELQAVSQDILLTNQALDKSKKESEDLKRELQTYVDEVRRVEKILLEKEREREALLEQFNALSAEANHLETTQQSLEYEANVSKDNLRDTQEKLFALQKDASAKDSLVSVMENQVKQLSDEVLQLQAKIAEMGNHELILATDLEAARHLCSTLEEQKQYYGKQLSQIASNEKVLRDELERLECENETLHNHLSQEQKSSYTLENILASSRHDVMEKCIHNEDLAKEVNNMKEIIVSLERKLNSVTSALSDCQSTCADYHSQNVHLKRQLTNEKFEKAKDLDSNSTSL